MQLMRGSPEVSRNFCLERVQSRRRCRPQGAVWISKARGEPMNSSTEVVLAGESSTEMTTWVRLWSGCSAWTSTVPRIMQSQICGVPGRELVEPPVGGTDEFH